jgi:magnesium chelatase family protein
MPSESKSSPREIQNYLGRISGPLLDRIDLHIEVPAVKFRDMSSVQASETSAQIRERVIAARQLQTQRFAAKPKVTCNARMGARELKTACELDEPTRDLLKHAMTEYNLSARLRPHFESLAHHRRLGGLGKNHRRPHQRSNSVPFPRPPVMGLMGAAKI